MRAHEAITPSAQAEIELTAASIGTLLIAGHDVMQKIADNVWLRAEDDSQHGTPDIADFHGRSGYSLITESKKS